MGDLPGIVVAALRLTAVGWLVVASPLELATTLARLVSRTEPLAHLAAALVLARVLVVALGLILGQRLAQRTGGLQALAWRWAAADLGTLGLVLATNALPTNRPPGAGPVVWVTYGALALVVVAAARAAGPPGR